MIKESDLTVFTKMLESAGISFKYEDSFIPIKVRVSPNTPFSITFTFDEDTGKLLGTESSE